MPRKKLSKNVEEITEDLVQTKEEVKKQEEKKKKSQKEVKISEEQKEETILTSLEDYIKTSSYLGTKVITPSMRKYVYRRRLDGLAILNTLIVDRKLKNAIDFIKQFKPEEWTLVCKREAGWRAVKMFSELTGVRIFKKNILQGF